MKRIFFALVALAIGSSAALAEEPKNLAEAIFAIGEAVCPEVADPVREADCLGETLELVTRAFELEVGISDIWVAGLRDGDRQAAEAIAAELKEGNARLLKDVEFFVEKYRASR